MALGEFEGASANGVVEFDQFEASNSVQTRPNDALEAAATVWHFQCSNISAPRVRTSLRIVQGSLRGIYRGALGSRQAVHVLSDRPSIGTVGTTRNIAETELAQRLAWLPVSFPAHGDAIVSRIARAAPPPGPLSPGPWSLL